MPDCPSLGWRQRGRRAHPTLIATRRARTVRGTCVRTRPTFCTHRGRCLRTRASSLGGTCSDAFSSTQLRRRLSPCWLRWEWGSSGAFTKRVTVGVCRARCLKLKRDMPPSGFPTAPLRRVRAPSPLFGSAASTGIRCVHWKVWLGEDRHLTIEAEVGRGTKASEAQLFGVVPVQCGCVPKWPLLHTPLLY